MRASSLRRAYPSRTHDIFLARCEVPLARRQVPLARREIPLAACAFVAPGDVPRGGAGREQTVWDP